MNILNPHTGLNTFQDPIIFYIISFTNEILAYYFPFPLRDSKIIVLFHHYFSFCFIILCKIKDLLIDFVKTNFPKNDFPNFSYFIG